MKNIRTYIVISILTVAALLSPVLQPQAYAHRVTVFAWVENGTVFTQSKFGAGAKVNNGKIFVYDQTGKELLNGHTDANGEFSFPIPAHSELKVVLDATMGHRAEWSIPLSEINEEVEQSTQESTATVTVQPTANTAAARLNEEQLEVVIEKILDRKLKPINYLLAEMNQSGPSLHDIVAGLGYIAGLIGVAAWVHARKDS